MKFVIFSLIMIIFASVLPVTVIFWKEGITEKTIVLYGDLKKLIQNVFFVLLFYFPFCITAEITHPLGLTQSDKMLFICILSIPLLVAVSYHFYSKYVRSITTLK